MVALIVNLAYLAISIGVTIKVGSMLHKHGTVFLIHHLQGLDSLAKSINNLLLVGFYLINIGYILIVMNLEPYQHETTNFLNFLSTHLGVILLSLGIVHFFLLRVLVMWRPKFFHTGVNAGDK
jgi:hypothetical protein